MGRKRLPEKEVKKMITFRLSQWVIDEIKEIPGYNGIVEKLITDYLKKNKKNDGQS